MRALLLLGTLLMACGDDDGVEDASAHEDASRDDAASDDASREDAGDEDAAREDADAAGRDADAAEDAARDAAEDVMDAAMDAPPREYPPVPEGLECEIEHGSAVPGVCRFETACGPNTYGVVCNESTGRCTCAVNGVDGPDFAIPRADYCADPTTPLPMQLYLFECEFPSDVAHTCGVTDVSGVVGACYYDGVCDDTEYRIVCSESYDTCECQIGDTTVSTHDFTASCPADGNVVWVRDCAFPTQSDE